MVEIVKGKNSKKAKAEPTKEEMHAVIVDILKRVDFNTVSTFGTIVSEIWMVIVPFYVEFSIILRYNGAGYFI